MASWVMATVMSLTRDVASLFIRVYRQRDKKAWLTKTKAPLHHFSYIEMK